jgi:hypothetical protein
LNPATLPNRLQNQKRRHALDLLPGMSQEEFEKDLAEYAEFQFNKHHSLNPGLPLPSK